MISLSRIFRTNVSLNDSIIVLILITLVCCVLYGLSIGDDKHKLMTINSDNSAAAIDDSDGATLQGFNATGSVVEEAIAAEDSHIKYPEFI